MRVGLYRVAWVGRAAARFALLAVCASGLALSGCGDSEPAPRNYPPLRFDYLTKLRLNVASVTIEDHSIPASAADLAPLSPVPPALALGTMAEDRLVAAGPSGKAVFVIDEASLTREPGNAIDGRMAVHLDIITAGGVRAAFAEARVSRQRSGIGPNEDQAGVLYDMTKQMMDDMNVEFEFQVRRTLREWLVTASAAPAPVSEAPLPATPPPPVASQAPMGQLPIGQAPTAAAPGPAIPLVPEPSLPSTMPASPTLSPPAGVLTPPAGARPAPPQGF